MTRQVSMNELLTHFKFKNFNSKKIKGDVIESLTHFIKESLKKERRYKGISTVEYMDCMGRMAVTKENKSKVIFI